MNESQNKLKALTGITALIGCTSLSIVVIIAIFSPSHLPVAAWMVAPLCLMGAALGLLATKS